MAIVLQSKTMAKENIYPLAPPDHIEAIAKPLSLPVQAIGEVVLNDPTRQTVAEWTHTVANSKRSDINPYAMGFIRDSAGEMQTIYGPKIFTSEREFLPDQILFGVENRREVFLLPPFEMKVSDPKLLQGKYWEYLPERLRQTLEDGKIIVTSGFDYYPLPVKDAQYGSFISPGVDMVDKLGKLIPDTDKWAILFTGEYKMHYEFAGRHGRTGVLVKVGSMGVEPITVEINNQEYIIELKGCGTSAGGFGESQERTGREIITGGCEAQQALDEIYELDRSETVDGAKAGAALVFENPDFTPYLYNGREPYRQGYIVRLSPSTLRASYSGMSLYPDVYEARNAQAVITMFTRGFIDGISEKNPKILDRSSHSENIALWGDGRFELTDFSDHVALNNPLFPHHEKFGGFMTVRTMLHYHLGMMAEIPGFNKVGAYRAVAQAFVGEFAQTDDIKFIMPSQPDQTSIGDQLWSKFLAKRVFDARSRNGYYPQGVEDEFTEGLSRALSKLDINDQAEFEAVFKKYSEGLTWAMDLVYPTTAPHVLADSNNMNGYEIALFRTSLWNLTTAFKTPGFQEELDGLLDIYRVREAFADLGEYFADEQDIVGTSLAGNPNSGELKTHQMEIEQKVARLELLQSSPGSMWQLWMDKSKLKEFLTLKAYNK